MNRKHLLLGIVAGSIICFWLLMTSLLVRLELYPEKAGVFTIPVSHVLKLVFQCGQISNLEVYENKFRIGNLDIHPISLNDQERYSLDFSGNLSLRLPADRQWLKWRGAMDMDHGFNIHNLKLDFDIHEFAYKCHINLNLEKNLLDYKITKAHNLIHESSIPLNDAAINLTLEKLGLDISLINNFRPQLKSPTLTAKKSALTVQYETIDVYQLTFHQDESVIADVYVSQLGQVLKAKTVFGYSMSPEEIIP